MLTGEVTPRATLRQFAEGWLGSKQYETAPGIFKFYTESVRKLFCHLRGNYRSATLPATRSWPTAAPWPAKGLASTTVNHHLEVARMLFKAARRDGLIADDPSEFVDPVKGKAGESAKRPFRLEELRTVLEEKRARKQDFESNLEFAFAETIFPVAKSQYADPQRW
jgi:hypothetical protein